MRPCQSQLQVGQLKVSRTHTRGTWQHCCLFLNWEGGIRGWAVAQQCTLIRNSWYRHLPSSCRLYLSMTQLCRSCQPLSLYVPHHILMPRSQTTPLRRRQNPLRDSNRLYRPIQTVSSYAFVLYNTSSSILLCNNLDPWWSAAASFCRNKLWGSLDEVGGRWLYWLFLCVGSRGSLGWSSIATPCSRQLAVLPAVSSSARSL